ncbi:hypothetical protein E4U61_001362 [Claviceps capensis]|nr:hypothetical protein E4U61_001362 [Claviceps capensis]
MIDTENLRTASLYINNQLLSRGLLRDGDTIDFAGTWLRDEEDAAVSGRIISLLNDLILRRDRDAEQRESLSMSMRSLRAENLKLTDDLARLHDKHTDVRRKADLALAAESTLKTQLKSAEAHARVLKEDAARMKSLVAQTRSSCTMEIRRRDRQIDTLKKQLGEAGRSRGTRANPAITTITVTGEVGSHEWNPTTGSLHGSNNTSEGSTDADPALRFMENETILGLARRLTEENDTMTGLMQDAMEQLRDMSGWTADTKSDEHVRKQPLLEDMKAELDAVMDHMRVILTNPSFVPIEEVVAREEEINRLKAGWVKMENRWKEAVHLMDGWRKRMAVSGKPVCDEELQMGIRLSPIRVQDMNEGSRPTEDHGLSVVREESEEENAHEFLRSPCPGNSDSRPGYAAREELELDNRGNHTDSDNDDDVAHHQDDLPIEPEDECAAPHGKQPAQQDFSLDDEDESLEPSILLAEPPQPVPLRHSQSAGNRGTLRNEKLRTRTRPSNDRGTSSGETTHRPPRDSKTMRSMPVRPGRLASQSTRLPSRATKTVQRPRFPSNTSLDEALLPPKRAAEKEDISSAPQSQNEEAEESEALQAAAATIKTHEIGRQQQTSTTSTSSHTSSSSSSPTTPRASNSRRTRRTPRGVEATVAQSPPAMSTIAAKLAASEREADAARVRAKLKAARTSTRGVSRPTITAAASAASAAATVTEEKQSSRDVGKAVMEARARQMELQQHEHKEEEEREIKTVQVEDAPVPQPEKRKRDRKATAVSSRRRSTLTPWELRTLMEGEVQ